MPPPEPRSKTVSPGFSCARAVGLPHPSEASNASSGICPICQTSYRFVVMGSQHAVLAVAPQQELPPVFTRKAASPYFCFTASLMSVVSVVLIKSLLFTDLYDVLRFKGFITSAAFGVK